MLKSLSQIDQRFALRTTTTTISSSTCHKSTFDLSPSSVERGKYSSDVRNGESNGPGKKYWKGLLENLMSCLQVIPVIRCYSC